MATETEYDFLDALDVLLSDDEEVGALGASSHSFGFPVKLEHEGDDSSDCTSTENAKKRKRSAYKEHDAELIAKATEENLKSLQVDPNSKEGKQIKRKIRNRMSAQFRRERK